MSSTWEVRINRPLMYTMDVIGPTSEVYGSPVMRALEEIPGIKAWALPDGLTHFEIPANAWGLLEVGHLLQEVGLTGAAWAQIRAHHVRGGVRGVAHDVRLREYQREAVQFLLANRQGILADQMGLGKTRTAALAAAYARRMMADDTRPILILGPSALRSTWKQELEKIEEVDARHPFLVCGSFNPDGWWKKRWGGQVGVHHHGWIYAHYEILDAWQYFLSCLRPAVVILDEAHLVKNSRTKRAKAVWSAMVNVPYRFLLTGTPLDNRPGDMWNLLQLACGRWSWGSPKEFRMRYAGAYNDEYGLRDGDRPTHVEEFRRRVQPVMLRRTVKDVGLELPPLTRQKVQVELDEGQRRQYLDVFEGYDPIHIFRALREKRMGEDTLRMFGRARKLTSDLKRSTTLEHMRSIAEQGEDVVVFVWEQRTANQLAASVRKPFGEAGKGVYAIHGGKPHKTRDQDLAHWQEGGGALVATYGTLGVGVNLQRCRFVILHDLEVKAATMLQAEARSWRGGQQRAVTSLWMTGKDTLDEILADLVMKKAAFIEKLANDAEPMGLAEIFEGEDDLVQRWVETWRRWREAA